MKFQHPLGYQKATVDEEAFLDVAQQNAVWHHDYSAAGFTSRARLACV